MAGISRVIDMFDINGQSAVITGGASGLGLAFAEAMADAGASVTILDIDGEGAAREADRLRSLGHNAAAAAVDITDRASVERAFDEVVRRSCRLDIVFANAGIDPGAGVLGPDGQRSFEGALENYEDGRWDKVIDTNLNSVFTTMRAAVRHMKERGGRIIVTTSAASSYSTGVALAYSAAKAGAAHMVRNAALQLARYNILVNAIAPGPFVTNIGDGLVKRPEVQSFMRGIIPLHRVATPDEIKGLALFLASPASAFITGAEIPIDGGLTLGTPID